MRSSSGCRAWSGHIGTSQRSRSNVSLRSRVHRLFKVLVERYFHRMPDRSETPYATHLPVLIAIPTMVSVEKVIEFGAGVHSTPTFLDRRVYPHLTQLHSYENDPTWADRVRVETGRDDRFTLSVIAEPMAEVANRILLDDADLVFLDDSTCEAERVRTIKSLAARKPPAVVVVHDFEIASYRHATKAFNYSYRVTSVNPNVGVVWNDHNRINLSSLRALDRRIRSAGVKMTLLDREDLIVLFGHLDGRRSA